MQASEENIGANLLLIKLSSLGDVIFNIPLANSLKKAGYKVTWMVGEKGFDVIKNNPCVDDVIFVPFEKWKKGGFSFGEYKSILNDIKNRKFDIVIDTQGRWKSLIFTLFCGVKRRIVGSNSKELARFGATEIAKIPKGWDESVVEKYLYFGKHLGINVNPKDMTLPTTESADKESVDAMLKDINPDKPLVVLCPQTTWSTKHWDKENWKELVNKFGDKYNLVFTGTDYDYLEYINQSKGINLAGKTTLKQLIEIFRRSDLVISLDSGSTHLANASRAKAIVSIFCSTPEQYYAPVGEKYIALAGNLKCRPCHKRKCKNKTYLCTQSLSVEEVFKISCRLIEEE